MRIGNSLLLLLTLGCTTQGYSGSAKSPEEIANIAVHSDDDVSLEGERIDGRPLPPFFSSMDVLPGEHTFDFKYRTEKETCYSSDAFCDVAIATGTCEGKVIVKPGRNYLVMAHEDSGSVSARVSAKSYFDFTERSDEPDAGFASCRELSSYDTFRRKTK